jgi:hypothetical protein
VFSQPAVEGVAEEGLAEHRLVQGSELAEGEVVPEEVVGVGAQLVPVAECCGGFADDRVVVDEQPLARDQAAVEVDGEELASGVGDGVVGAGDGVRERHGPGALVAVGVVEDADQLGGDAERGEGELEPQEIRGARRYGLTATIIAGGHSSGRPLPACISGITCPYVFIDGNGLAAAVLDFGSGDDPVAVR